jgi:hypothetical protein
MWLNAKEARNFCFLFCGKDCQILLSLIQLFKNVFSMEFSLSPPTHLPNINQKFGHKSNIHKKCRRWIISFGLRKTIMHFIIQFPFCGIWTPEYCALQKWEIEVEDSGCGIC